MRNVLPLCWDFRDLLFSVKPLRFLRINYISTKWLLSVYAEFFFCQYKMRVKSRTFDHGLVLFKTLKIIDIFYLIFYILLCIFLIFFISCEIINKNVWKHIKYLLNINRINLRALKRRTRRWSKLALLTLVWYPWHIHQPLSKKLWRAGQGFGIDMA